MMISKAIQAAIVGAITFFSLPISGQDLMARQAPIDRKMKAVDSVSLQRLIKTEQLQNYSTIYPDWNNKSVHNYHVDLPDSFRIDLRHFCMPTPSRRITSRYGYRRAYRRDHKGLDIKVYTGDTIRAAFDGKVRIVRYEAKGYGNYVVIRHPNGLETVYGHLSKQLVQEDQVVKAGDVIGLGGNTGRSTGSHLHFETRLLGQAIDPELLFDFPDQDVTGDYFVFYNETNNHRNNAYASTKVSNVQEDVNGDGVEDEIVEVKGKPAGGVKYHKVRAGENLYAIANKYNTTVERLCSINRISTNVKLRPGQVLRYM